MHAAMLAVKAGAGTTSMPNERRKRQSKTRVMVQQLSCQKLCCRTVCRTHVPQ